MGCQTWTPGHCAEQMGRWHREGRGRQEEGWVSPRQPGKVRKAVVTEHQGGEEGSMEAGGLSKAPCSKSRFYLWIKVDRVTDFVGKFIFF